MNHPPRAPSQPDALLLFAVGSNALVATCAAWRPAPLLAVGLLVLGTFLVGRHWIEVSL